MNLLRMTMRLPKRTPDPANALAGAFQGLLSEYISTTNQALFYIEDDEAKEALVQRVSKVHAEALHVLQIQGARAEEAKKS